jgi:hypothetical protein
MFDKMFGRSKADDQPYYERLEAIEGTNARATARRLVRASRSAPMIRYPEVTLTKAEEKDLRARVAKDKHIKPDDVDLDEIVIPSGEYRRRLRRFVVRAERKKRRKGQRAFNRMVRENPEPQPGNHQKIVAARERREVARLIEAGVDPQEAYSQVVGG